MRDVDAVVLACFVFSCLCLTANILILVLR